MPKSIVILTTGQPSTNPRTVKEYMALKKAGYNVKVLYCFWTKWALRTDRKIFTNKYIDEQDFILIGGSPEKNKAIYILSRVFHKVAKLLSTFLSFSALEKYTIARPAIVLEIAASRIQADLYIGHNLGALPASVKAAKANKAKCGFDVEDFYSGQFYTGDPKHTISARIERKYIPQCDYLTFSSSQIERKYESLISGRGKLTLPNVMIKDEVVGEIKKIANRPLKLVWFSQQIGEGRGLEVVVDAMNKLHECQITLDLLGNCTESYKDKLLSLISEPHRLKFHNPIAADEITKFLSDNHIGLATETARDQNNDIALSNKIFSYLAAGNVIIASDTTAQKDFLEQNLIGFLFEKNNSQHLKEVLENLYYRENLEQARLDSLELARSVYNWDIQKIHFLSLIKNILEKN